ncbi:FAD-dependent oxidoreductase [Paenibacillus ginsengarvi]|uniref:FAD-dependent oxidoreductase n=1 Tax=Paenibacillus ginsengarvi TaxID=400777 RepID=A0A3B0CI43_9BACL|nr:FAD-dependent oxidoreductase [Paenibacillus ginsengarvi]RKN84862.1 FAD-dependent oxidoreductase [Paenibacillus ginsengarvi]
MSKKWIFTMTILLVALLGMGAGLYSWQMNDRSAKSAHSTNSPNAGKREPQQVVSVAALKDSYDLVVVGTDPEGIAAAVSAARNGQRTLLVDARGREVLGGLMTVGWLNSIDMNWDRTSAPLPGQEQDYFNKGIFAEWYKKTEGHSFDVVTAADAFYNLVRAESGIDLYMEAAAVEPIVRRENGPGTVEGVVVRKKDGSKQRISSKAVIDATQDADIAVAAGASFTIGREDLGDKNSRMAVTAVFRLKNIDDKAWKLIAKRLNGDGDSNTGVDKMSAWGYGNEMKDYVPLNKERTKMRGLNIGRQLDDTILINALQIFGIDGLSEESRREGLEIARQEIPHVVDYLKQFEEFKNAELDAIAPELYVRETRHLAGLYRLSVIDLLENADQWDRIAFGSYPADIQRTSPTDNGAVVVHPLKYAVPFRSIVPQHVDGLLVVGRSASFDTLAHGSARVIPLGMAEGQAAGAAVKLASEQNKTFSELSQSKALMAELQKRLNDQGMELAPYKPQPQTYMSHPAYEGLKAAVYTGIAVGSYNNEAFKLDNPSNAQRMVNQVNNIRRMYKTSFKGDPSAAVKQIAEPAKQPLTLQQASLTIAKGLGLDVTAETARAELESRGMLTKETVGMIKDERKLTDGEAYMMLKDAIVKAAGVTF